MDEVTLKLTKEECRQLLRHVYIANWILTATKDAPEKATEDFTQKIFKLLATSGIESRIEKDKTRNMYFVDEKLEGEFLEEIDEYNEDSFIEELIDQLTKKEIAGKYDEEEIARMNEAKFNKVFDEIQEKYIDEISSNGMRNVEVVKAE
jgi:hypothetical protein